MFQSSAFASSLLGFQPSGDAIKQVSKPFLVFSKAGFSLRAIDFQPLREIGRLPAFFYRLV